MPDFTIYNGDCAENKMILYPENLKDRLIGLFIYYQDKKNPEYDEVEREFSFSYQDSILLRDYLTSVIDLYDKEKSKKFKRKEIERKRFDKQKANLISRLMRGNSTKSIIEQVDGGKID